MHGEDISYAYGLWSIVLLNAGLFIFFILSFLAPLRKREWRSMGVTIAFFVALFTEMFGFPLTIFILTSMLGGKYPALNPFSHESGHLWVLFLGGGELMFTVFHFISNALAITGFCIMWRGWKLIHRANGSLVTGGPYAYVRHPQYSALFLVMIGMLFEWPTIITILMFPVLTFIYYRLAKREEQDMLILFGYEYTRYKRDTPMFIPQRNTLSYSDDRGSIY
jgi:protein-S-isoprenylcysteine O-methyltransferase Ste14